MAREYLRLLSLFFIFLFLISGLVYSISRDPSDEEIIRERLKALGYPSVGLVLLNQTVKYSDGRVIVYYPNWKVRAYYPVTPLKALEAVRKELGEANEKLGKFGKEHNKKTISLMLKVDPKTLDEIEKDGSLYWVFEVYLYKGSRKLGFAGFAYVNRMTGIVTWEGLLG